MEALAIMLASSTKLKGEGDDQGNQEERWTTKQKISNEERGRKKRKKPSILRVWSFEGK
jgi:hypothetical protein